jgi:hypothetical protein
MKRLDSRYLLWADGELFAFHSTRTLGLYARAEGASPTRVLVADHDEKEFVVATLAEMDGTWTVTDDRNRLYMKSPGFELGDDPLVYLVAAVFEEWVMPLSCNIVRRSEWVERDRFSKWGVHEPVGEMIDYCPEVIAPQVAHSGREDFMDLVEQLGMMVSYAAYHPDDGLEGAYRHLVQDYPQTMEDMRQVFDPI